MNGRPPNPPLNGTVIRIEAEREDNVFVAVLFDLLSPFVAIGFYIRLVRVRRWSSWAAYLTVSAGYVLWAYAVAVEVGYSLSSYVLTFVSLGTQSLLAPTSSPGTDRSIALLVYPAIAIVFVPSALLWLGSTAVRTFRGTAGA